MYKIYKGLKIWRYSIIYKMPTKEEVFHDVIRENKKNIKRLMKMYECTYTEAVILWLKLNKKYMDNIIIMRADNDGVRLL